MSRTRAGWERAVPVVLIGVTAAAVGWLLVRGVDRAGGDRAGPPSDTPAAPPGNDLFVRRTTSWPGVTPYDLTFTPDGRHLVVAGAETDAAGDRPTVRVWDLEADQDVAVVHDPRGRGRFTTVAVSPDGAAVAAGGVLVADGAVGGTLASWGLLSGGRPRWAARPVAEVTAVAWSPDGKQLAFGDRDTAVRLADAGSGAVLGRLPADELGGGGVGPLAWRPDGARLAAGGAAAVRVWDMTAATAGVTVPAEPGGVARAAFTPDGAALWVAGAATGDLRAWDLAANRESRRVRTRPGLPVGFALARDGRLGVTVAVDHALHPAPVVVVRGWDLEAGGNVWWVESGSDPTPVDRVPFAVGPDGRSVAFAVSTREDGGARWQVRVYAVPGP